MERMAQQDFYRVGFMDPVKAELTDKKLGVKQMMKHQIGFFCAGALFCFSLVFVSLYLVKVRQYYEEAVVSFLTDVPNMPKQEVAFIDSFLGLRQEFVLLEGGVSDEAWAEQVEEFTENKSISHWKGQIVNVSESRIGRSIVTIEISSEILLTAVLLSPEPKNVSPLDRDMKPPMLKEGKMIEFSGWFPSEAIQTQHPDSYYKFISATKSVIPISLQEVNQI